MEITLTRMTPDQRRDSGWAGWGGEHNLYNYSPQDAPEDQLLEAMAQLAWENKNNVYVIQDSYYNKRVIGWDYTKQGYSNTLNGPKISITITNGDYKRNYGSSQSPFMPQHELEILCSCLRMGLEPNFAVEMTHDQRLLWYSNKQTERFS
jgi:hypothetical protein